VRDCARLGPRSPSRAICAATSHVKAADQVRKQPAKRSHHGRYAADPHHPANQQRRKMGRVFGRGKLSEPLDIGRARTQAEALVRERSKRGRS
jgi:hypothetical protein